MSCVNNSLETTESMNIHCNFTKREVEDEFQSLRVIMILIWGRLNYRIARVSRDPLSIFEFSKTKDPSIMQQSF